jgi:hypothetical protein
MKSKQRPVEGHVMAATEDSTVRQVMDEFRTTYADSLDAHMSQAQWWRAEKVRRLNWQSPHRIALADAVRCYVQIDGGYNEFDPTMIGDLHDAFRDDGIQVTPAREYSVAIYLHVPDVVGLRLRVELFVRTHFRADEVSWQDEGTLRCWWD